MLERVGKGEILTPSHSSSKQRPFIHKVPEYVKMLSSGPSSYQETGFGLLRWVMGDDWWQLHALVDDPKGVFKGWGTEWQAAVSAYSKQVYKPWITDWESVGEWGEHVTRRSRHLKNAVKNLLGESASAIPIVGSPVASMVFPKLMGFGSATLSDLKKAVVGGSDKDYYWGLVAQDEEYTQLGGLHEPLSSYDTKLTIKSAYRFKEAASRGYVEAMCEYGYCCETGWKHWVSKGADGRLVKKNSSELAKAKEWYRRAIKAKSPVGHYLLARLLLLESQGQFSKEIVGHLQQAAREDEKNRVPGACYLLGRYYEQQAADSPVHLQEAIKWYTGAMKDDIYPPAAFALAKHCIAEKKYSDAIWYYERATHPLSYIKEGSERAEGYFPDEQACYEYALILRDGLYGVKQNPIRALQCLLLGQRFGRPDANSLCELGCWLAGERLIQPAIDLKLAESLFEAACQLSAHHQLAEPKMRLFRIVGLSRRPENIAEEFNQLKLLAESGGHPVADLAVGWCFEHGIPNLVQPIRESAQKCFEAAVEAGLPIAHFYLGDGLEQGLIGETKPQPMEAMEHYKLGAEQGDLHCKVRRWQLASRLGLPHAAGYYKVAREALEQAGFYHNYLEPVNRQFSLGTLAPLPLHLTDVDLPEASSFSSWTPQSLQSHSGEGLEPLVAYGKALETQDDENRSQAFATLAQQITNTTYPSALQLQVLAMLHLYGLGVEQNLGTAKKLISDVRNQGTRIQVVDLVSPYLYGMEGVPDIQRALEILGPLAPLSPEAEVICLDLEYGELIQQRSAVELYYHLKPGLAHQKLTFHFRA
ncbi:MAG: hypothetical protein AB7F31_01485 [Parachlamydiales bacterium]